MIESIIAEGNRGHVMVDNNTITCADGFTMSVIAGGGTYCTPKPVFCACHFDLGIVPLTPGLIWPHEVAHDFPGPYTHVEVGFPSERPEPWDHWKEHSDTGADPVEAVYSNVPVELVRSLIAAHGGEKDTK